MTELTTTDFPDAVVTLAVVMIVLGVGSAVGVAVDVARRPQPMRVMDVVWPVTALFGSLLWVAAYLRWGRAPRRGEQEHRHGHDEATPMPVAVFTGTSHCGAGCMLGDLLVEWTVVLVPALVLLGGYDWLFDDRIYAVWVLDYVAAFVIGIAFQYFAIAPMRGLGLRAGLRAAVKADALSITAWQVGMYGTMAVVQLWWLPEVLGGRAAVTTPVFWAAMQVAMVVGFATSYPVNWWLVRTGVKERM
ncbi:uncharacterized protein DUF4396 [Isoptericola jiangsuensis]|uniref:Uncharacterized protein DUF4396 n=1 Tax=Isoptericola jiangsuensis TaxID=548579 RepID=A0A2A9ES79_9MICO|nr:DUF4396 domain-containing protein [Isoptericola jiangsuensis]PFG41613.1 uncharacterized protein DUF4396 [Isoptericola jiangsuensis]